MVRAKRKKSGRSASLKRFTAAARVLVGLLPGFATFGTRLRRAGIFTASVLAVWLLFVGLFYVWTRMQLVQIGYEIAKLEEENKDLKKRKGELTLEIASLESPCELEKQARTKAGLVFPEMGKVVHVP
ncbi:MAG: septum formation initiator family protein [Pseudomonadota bacterium]